MPRYIDADKLKEHIASFTGMFNEESFMIDYNAVLTAIDNAPTANVAPKSEVAREFIDAVDQMLNLVCAMTGLELMFFGKYAELKKKYTEEKLND